MTSRIFRGSGIVYTDQGAAGDIFHPLTDPVSANLVTIIRMSVYGESFTQNLQVKRAYQYSNDKITWDTAATLGSYIATEGMDYPGSSGTDITTSQKLFVRFGVVANQVTGTALEMGRVTIEVEVRDA